ncbi:MAG: MarR family transcriptional regulator [Alphaproteobacteria bacterium]|nr:MarR family transcriptional regulator [Alphaproteobacteria bacterium]
MGVFLSVGQALAILRDAILESVRYDPRDLTQRQTAVMLMVYLSSAPMTVRGLAAALAVGKPAISRALDRLEALGLLRRMPDTRDRRSIIVARTFAGTVYVHELADRMVTAAALSQD